MMATGFAQPARLAASFVLLGIAACGQAGSTSASQPPPTQQETPTPTPTPLPSCPPTAFRVTLSFDRTKQVDSVRYVVGQQGPIVSTVTNVSGTDCASIKGWRLELREAPAGVDVERDRVICYSSQDYSPGARTNAGAEVSDECTWPGADAPGHYVVVWLWPLAGVEARGEITVTPK